MRTTLNIDDDLLQVARCLSEAKAISLGAVISELAKKGLERTFARNAKTGFPVFSVPPDAHPITLEQVKKLEDED